MNHNFWKVSYLVFISLILIVQVVDANEIVEIPDEELARESVLPIFDDSSVVKNRNVPLSNKFEFGAFLGTNVNEAFYDQILYGAQGTYHFSEMSGVQILFSMINAAPSQYVSQLNTISRPPMSYERLPKPKYFFLGSYELTPFYGKLSVTKQSVINLTTFATAGVGMFAIGDTQTPVLGLGLGQNFFFGKSWGLKLDMKSLFYSGIDPISVNLNDAGEDPSVSRFSRQIVINFTVSAGLVILL